MNDIVEKNILFDYFSGQTTPLQKKTIEDWLQKPENQEQYYVWLHEWELAHLQSPVSWEKAFTRTQEQLIQLQSTPFPVNKTTQQVNWWSSFATWGVAASISITLLAGLFVVKRDAIYYKTVQSGYGQTRQLALEDGSVVTLNANSSLKLPRFGFGEGSREVELTGEADFQIQHTPHHQPFVVKTVKGLKITVLGTQFTVFDRLRRSQVVLRSGKITLQVTPSPRSPLIVMKPGDLVAVDQAGKLIKEHTSNPEIHASWRHNRFTLERTSLREIASMLQENYGFDVVINDPELAAHTATGSFPTQNVDEVLEMISDLFDINVTRQNNKIIFKE